MKKLKRFKLSRRTMLRGALGAGAVSVGLPALDVFLNDNGTAHADGSALPRRFGLYFWGNGVQPPLFNPIGEGQGDEWSLGEQLAAFTPVKDVISIVSGTKVYTGNPIAHDSGVAGVLTGAPLVFEGESYTFQRPTIDQVIASEIGGQTLLRSLEIGVQRGMQGRSYNGPNSRNPVESSPAALFDRLFGATFREPGDEPIIDPRLALRRSVLDAVSDQSRRLRRRVGHADQLRLDEHFQNVRALELRLARLEEDPPDLAACMRPDAPLADYPDIEGRPRMMEIHRAQVETLRMALACDLTRVFSLWFTDPVNNTLFPGRSAGHHRLTHDEPGEQPEVSAIMLEIMREAAYCVERLESVEEGDGTLLDNTAMLMTTDCSYARQHLLEDYPIILAGGCCGRLKQGLHYRSTGFENTSKVLLTLTRMMGLRLDSFGIDDGEATDGLSAIEV